MWRDWIPFSRGGISAHGAHVDLLFVGLLLLSAAIMGLLFFLMLDFVVRYRAGNRVSRQPRIRKSWRWEVGWTSATVAGFLVLFIWGAFLFLQAANAPSGTPEIFIVGKQWMWKVQHPAGAREINELHIPVGATIRLVLASEDVIHSFFIPALRMKQDAVPGRYQQLEIEADRPGVYPFFCAEFCGTDHSRMVGRVIALTPPDYERWTEAENAKGSLASEGEALFRSLGCAQCHSEGAAIHAPQLDYLYGQEVERNGRILRVDESFLRDSILFPRKHPPQGFDPVMPSYEGRISEEQLFSLVAYIKSLALAKGGNDAR